MRALGKILLAAAAASAVTGCSWAAFDDLADETWVDRAGVPDGVSSNLYGEAVAAGGVRAAGSTVMVIGRNNATIGTLAFDDNGVRSQKDNGDVGKTFAFAAFQEHPAFAGDPLSTKVATAVVTLNGDDPNSNTKFIFYDTVTLTPKQIEMPDVIKGKQRSNGLAFSDIDNDTKRDLIAARGDQAIAITDWNSTDGTGSAYGVFACVHGEQDAYAIASTDFDADQIPEIVLSGGTSDRSGPSKIFIFEPSAITASNAGMGAPPASCFATPALVTLDKDSVHDLGAQLAIVDEGSGPWIVATSPLTNQLFVFQNPTTGNDQQLLIQSPPGAGAFGESLAVGDLDGDGKPELVVGAPKTTVDGKANAGAVFIYKFDGAAFGQPFELHDSSPEVEQHFGKAVAVVPFGTGDRNIVTVGADGEVFTYFRTKAYDEVRAGRQ